jgi:hypothetical protein
MPPYPGVSQVMEVSTTTTTATTKAEGESTSGWEAEYAAYLQSKYMEEENEQSTTTDEPSSASAPKVKDEPLWEAQYATYCAEKEARLAEEDAKQLAARKKEAQMQ